MPELAINGGRPIRTKPWPKWPIIGKEEKAAVIELLDRAIMGRVTVFGKGEDSQVDQFREAWLRQYPGKEYAIPCSSCCTALELSLRNAGIGPGDEVITPASTWVATNLAPAMVGATPVIVDVSPENYCIDPDAIEAAITPRTSAIIPVHVGGYCCEMDRIMEIAERHHLVVIEDCAQAQDSKYKDKFVGNWGHFGCFSFDIAKLMTSGEGGLVVCDDRDLGEWVYGICGQAGKQIDQISGGEARKIDGWNFRMTELQAAILLVQLTRAEELKHKRMANADYLRLRMREIEGIGTVPHSPEQNYYSFMFRYDSERFSGATKQQFVEALGAEGVPTFCSPGSQAPVYRSPYFHSHGQDLSQVHCPVAERAFEEEAVGFHSTYMLIAEKEDMDDIVAAIVKVLEHADELVS